MNSMTGFGRAAAEGPHGAIAIELRSLNNRYLEAVPRLGAWFPHLEIAVRDRMRARFARGKIDMTVRFTPAESLVPAPRLNKAALAALAAEVESVMGRPPAVEALLSAPGMFLADADPSADDALSAAFLGVLDRAMDALAEARRSEGGALAEALAECSARMRVHAQAIEAARPAVVAKYRERLAERIEQVLGREGAALDPGRLEQEVAVFADKADISEECSRLAAHLDALDRLAATKGKAVGKQLEFLCQELLREVNTTGSKCRDLDIARTVLDLKNELESLRELVANIE